jgi:SAM-dependent methyltransferase
MSDITRRFYDEHANLYIRNTQDLQSKEFIELFMKGLPGKEVLDVGCAYGRDSATFLSNGFHVTGVDFSPVLIEEARKRVPGATFLVQDMRSLSFPSASFDGIWAAACILHLAKHEVPRVFSEFHQLLRPSGLFFCGVKLGSGEGVVNDERYGGAQKFESYFQEDELRALLADAGFEILSALRKDPADYRSTAVVEVVSQKVGT